MNIYINKFTPSKSSNFIGHFKFINDFKDYIINKHENNNKIILCLGQSGIGKTNLLKLLFKEMNYECSEINDFENIKDTISNLINNKTINSFFSKKKKIILIDDLEILINLDKTILSSLLKMRNDNKIPIICIANKIFERKLGDFKKSCHIFYMNKPNFNLTLQYFIKIINKLNIELTKKKLENLKKYINLCRNNIKFMLLNLDIYLDNDEINKDIILNQNFNDSGLFDIVNNIYNKKYDIEDIGNIVHSDSSLISMLLHENLITELESRRKIKDKREIISIYKNIIDEFCISDIMEQFVFSNNEWSLLQLLYITKIYKFNSLINQYPLKENNENNIFTQILTKYSIKCNYNKKKTKLLNDNLLTENNFDYFVQIILNMINNIKSNEEMERIILRYKINKDSYDVINKYNKENKIIDINKIKKMKKFIKK